MTQNRTPQPDSRRRGEDRTVRSQMTVREALSAEQNETDGLLCFLTRLSRFGLVAGAGPLLRSMTTGS